MDGINPDWHWREHKKIVPHTPGVQKVQDPVHLFSGSRIVGGKKTIGSLSCLRSEDIEKLIHANIQTVDDLSRLTRERLLEIGIPRYTINQIREIFYARGKALPLL